MPNQSDALSDIGVKFWVGNSSNGASSTYVEIAEVVALTPPVLERDFPEATHLNSNAGFRQVKAGLKSVADVAADLNFVTDAALTALLADYDSGILRDFKVSYPLSGTPAQLFSAGVKAIGPSPLDPKALLRRRVVLAVSGAMTQTGF